MAIRFILSFFFIFQSTELLAHQARFCGKEEKAIELRDKVDDIFDSIHVQFNTGKGALNLQEAKKVGEAYWLNKASYQVGSKGGLGRWCHEYYDNFEELVSPFYLKIGPDFIERYNLTTEADDRLYSEAPKLVNPRGPNYLPVADGKSILSKKIWELSYEKNHYQTRLVEAGKDYETMKRMILMTYWPGTKIPVLWTRSGRVGQSGDCWVRYQDRFNTKLCTFESKKLLQIEKKFKKAGLRG